MSSSSQHPRASLLAGLRTGGVRSNSTNLPNPHSSLYSEEDDQYPSVPMTAAVDGSNIRFSHQQAQFPLNPNSVPFSPAAFPPQNVVPHNQLQNQAFQMQLLQLEMMRIQSQALQAQQFQAELIAQAQRQQQQSQVHARERRTSLNPPATAGPHITAFDLRSATLSAQMRRANQTEQLKTQLGLASHQVEDQVPMTAALGGRFGGRIASASNNLSRYIIEGPEEMTDQLPPPPRSIITASHNVNSPLPLPSRSDQVANWRRGGSGNSTLNGNYRTVSSPAVKITPPPPADNQRSSSPSGMAGTNPATRGRPQPLNITPAASKSLPTVAVDTAEEDDTATCSSSGSASIRSVPSDTFSPITPPSSALNNGSQLSPREEATKKLYEGLGIGRSVPSIANQTESCQVQQQVQAISNHRMVSQPTRQPRGPPSGADELGPKNFATRIRRQAIGGLEMLMGARERREVEAY